MGEKFESFPDKRPGHEHGSQPGGFDTMLVEAGGLQFGEGSISVTARIEDLNDPLTPEMLDKVHDIVKSPEILVPIEADDDGCGDGRGVKRIFKAIRSSIKIFKRSLNRPKVFGGGLMMGVAARIGLGDTEDDLKDIFDDEALHFAEAGINYGVHTAENAPDDKSGCGAIDFAPENIENVVKYRDEIEQTITSLSPFVFGGDADENVASRLSGVLDNFAGYAKSQPNKSHSGAEIVQSATKDEKVVKELDNDEGHREVAIVLNFVEGMTVNQRLVRDETDNVAQVFGVDIPRIVEIAKKRYEDPKKQTDAILSMLVYTLSTASTLTDGSLPVYAVKPKLVTSSPAN